MIATFKLLQCLIEKELIPNKQIKSEINLVLFKITETIDLTRKCISDNQSGNFADPKYKAASLNLLSLSYSEIADAIAPYNNDISRIIKEKNNFWSDPNCFLSEIVDSETRLDYIKVLDEIKDTIIK